MKKKPQFNFSWTQCQWQPRTILPESLYVFLKLLPDDIYPRVLSQFEPIRQGEFLWIRMFSAGWEAVNLFLKILDWGTAGRMSPCQKSSKGLLLSFLCFPNQPFRLRRYPSFGARPPIQPTGTLSFCSSFGYQHPRMRSGIYEIFKNRIILCRCFCPIHNPDQLIVECLVFQFRQ